MATIVEEMEASRPSIRSRLLLAATAVALATAAFFFSQKAGPVSLVSKKESSPPATLLPSDSAATETAIRFYKTRIQRDPEDTRSQNALAEYYLKRVHESGNEDYLPLALEAARASLAAVVAERNIGGLTALAHAEFANHDFSLARDHALQLIKLDPGKSEPYAILGDAQLELGDYDEAAESFTRMAERSEQRAGIEMRLARLAVIRGETKQAEQHFRGALDDLLESPKPPRETVAWCRWQLGETAFSAGDYETAERHYEDALTTAPGYFRALASLGRLLAARGDLPGAISRYEEAVRITPAPAFVGALGDLYQLSGMNADAQARFEMVEQLGEHSRKVHGSAFNRPLALFYADHGMQTEEAYQLARTEYDAGRHDVYGADAVAWTALKAGHLPEAQTAMKAALRLGTKDARLFYHAAMIAKASGDRTAAADFLRQALALNPGFDPLQRQFAQKALKD